ncbi:MAG: 30S ribosomal protein S13 [Candidatus Aenigmatarchaeota archaeon]
MAKDLKSIVRIMETNLDGNKPVKIAIRKIRGVSFMFGNAISFVYKNPDKIVGELSDDEIKELEDVIANPAKYNIPSWLYDRRFDPATGKNMHLSVSQLDFTKRMDINTMKKLKTYKGVRHSIGLPVRGQRTRSSFRKGSTVGVRKKKAKGK